MPGAPLRNRSMFWRILGRLLRSNRGRLLVVLLALGAGAAVTAALLNLKVDAERRLREEFRTLGANVAVTPRNPSDAPGYLDQALFAAIPPSNDRGEVRKTGFLYGVVEVRQPAGRESREAGPAVQAILAGYLASGSDREPLLPAGLAEAVRHAGPDGRSCVLGQKVALALAAAEGQPVELRSAALHDSCNAILLAPTGGAADDQIFLDLPRAQALLREPGRVSLLELSVPGSRQEIERFVATLTKQFPEAASRPLRQFTEAQAGIYSRISGVLAATVFVVLLLTALCVLAAMTNVAMERKMDVAMMKAIGGSASRVTRIFLAEAAILGLLGGLVGAAAGLVVSIGLGQAVFGVAAEPRFIVYPVSVALTLIVAILASYPLRHLAGIQPAAIFRGDR